MLQRIAVRALNMYRTGHTYLPFLWANSRALELGS